MNDRHANRRCLPARLACGVLPAALSAVLPAAAGAPEWTRFRGPGAAGVVADNPSLSERWSADENVGWRTAIPSLGSSSPRVVWSTGPVVVDAMHRFVATQDAVDIHRPKQEPRAVVGATLIPARATPARAEDCPMGVVEKNGQRLSTLEEWFDVAGPKGGDLHWKDGRSAKESAGSWLAAAPALPAEIASTLSSHADIGRFCDWRAEPEAQVSIDDFRGPPNVDVLLVGSDSNGPVVVAVEAKADEPS